MFDILVRRHVDPWLVKLAEPLAASGLTANSLTWTGFLLGMSGAAAAALGHFGPAFFLIAANRLLDGLDGCVARLRGPTDVGGYLDIVLDMIFYSSLPMAFALFHADNRLPAAFLIYSFMGTGSSFLTFAIISAKRGRFEDRTGKKSFFYSIGLIEGTETAVFLLLICLVPQYFPVLAWTFGGLCWVTTGIRIAVAYRTFLDR